MNIVGYSGKDKGEFFIPENIIVPVELQNIFYVYLKYATSIPILYLFYIHAIPILKI